MVIMGIITTAMEEVTEELGWRWGWDYWGMASVTTAGGRLITLLHMDMETGMAILPLDTGLIMDMRLTMGMRPTMAMRSLMDMPLLLRLLPRRPFTSRSKKLCRPSHRLKLPTIGTTAGSRKGTTLM